VLEMVRTGALAMTRGTAEAKPEEIAA
jgi:acetolactate synthase small subunit